MSCPETDQQKLRTPHCIIHKQFVLYLGKRWPHTCHAPRSKQTSPFQLRPRVLTLPGLEILASFSRTSPVTPSSERKQGKGVRRSALADDCYSSNESLSIHSFLELMNSVHRIIHKRLLANVLVIFFLTWLTNPFAESSYDVELSIHPNGISSRDVGDGKRVQARDDPKPGYACRVIYLQVQEKFRQTSLQDVSKGSGENEAT